MRRKSKDGIRCSLHEADSVDVVALRLRGCCGVATAHCRYSIGAKGGQ
jgi:hypothetical protein